MNADKLVLLHGPLRLSRKTGLEPFHTSTCLLGISLAEFWQWSVSDLVSNATRGRLAEFIVAKALGIPTTGIRNEWGAFDLITLSGLKIEVKSSAYVQSWAQQEFSSISFSIKKSRAWDAETNLLSKELKHQADVYVFAFLKEKNWEILDPLNIDQWDFYALPTTTLNQGIRSLNSISLKRLQTLTGKSVSYFELNEAVQRLKPNPSEADPSTSSG